MKNIDVLKEKNPIFDVAIRLEHKINKNSAIVADSIGRVSPMLKPRHIKIVSKR